MEQRSIREVAAWTGGRYQGPDLPVAGAGSVWGDGKIANADGTARFSARLREGAGAELVPSTPPPPFAFESYVPGVDNEFHVIIRSHGPRIPGLVHEQRLDATASPPLVVDDQHTEGRFGHHPDSPERR